MAAPSAHFSGGFLEADYLALPWLMTIMRYDRVQSTADFLNARDRRTISRRPALPATG